MAKLKFKRDITIVLFILILAPILSLVFQANFLISMIFYFVLVSIYLSFRTPKAIKKAALIALPTIPIVLSFDYVAFLNNAWAVPTIFPFRILTLIPLEDFIFALLFVYTIVMIREHFFESSHSINYRRLKNFTLATLVLATLFFILLIYFPNLLKISYYYAWLVLVLFISPTVAGFILFPKTRSITLTLLPYFLVIMLSYELIALHLGIWFFPSSQYLGIIQIFGLKFPIEEFLTWMLFALPATLSLAELGTGNEEMEL